MMWLSAVMTRQLAALALIAFLAAPASALANGHGEAKKGGGATFIQLGAITATTQRGGGQRGSITVETGIDVPNPDLYTKASLLIPRFRAAYAQSVQTYGAGLGPAALPNADFLSRELQRQTDLVLGKPGAKLLVGTILVN
jgi:hypothetical protein